MGGSNSKPVTTVDPNSDAARLGVKPKPDSSIEKQNTNTQQQQQQNKKIHPITGGIGGDDDDDVMRDDADVIKADDDVHDDDASAQKKKSTSVLGDATTAETAWEAGKQAIASEELLELAGVFLPGVLEVASSVPWVGPVAGILLKFYNAFKGMQDNMEAFVELKDRLDDAVLWLREVVPKMQHMDSQIVEKTLRNLVAATDTGTSYIEAVGKRLNADRRRSIGDRIKGMILSDVDMQKIAAVTKSVEKAVADLRQTIPAILLMQQQAMSMSSSKLKELEKLLNPIRFDSEVNTHLDVFVKGSREWLFEETMQCLDTPSSNATAFGGGGGGGSMKNNLIWLRAEAGMGKSAFSAALIDRLRGSGQLLGAALFTFSDEQRSDPIVLIKSLAYQVVEVFPELLDPVTAAVEALHLEKNKPDLGQLFKALLLEPLQSLKR